MSKQTNIIKFIETLFESDILAEYVDFELVDVVFVKEGPQRYLRVFIDKPDGVTIDDCADVSRLINKKLDEIDPIDEAYILEVSSPGVERPLKKEADFIRFIGSDIAIKLYAPIDGTKKIEGLLEGFDAPFVVIKRRGSDTAIKIEREKIASAKLLFEF